MAKGTAGGRAGWVVAGLIVLVVLVATNVWNPFPDMWEWVSRTRPLSSPDTAWQQSVGGQPKSVTITGSVAVVEQGTSVEGRSLGTGVRLWKREVNWGAVAGEGDNAVVVVGELLKKGYEVIDPRSGIVWRKDTQAVAVWTYRDALLDVRCSDAKDCTLSAWEPRGTKPRWTAELPGVGFVLFADNPDLLDAKPLTARGIAGDVAGPVVLPSLLGFPIDNKVRVVDTSDGRVARDFEPEREDRYAVVGGRLVRVEARSGDGTCYFTVTATDAATDRQVWQKEALNLRTASGAGCTQRDDPNGGQNVVVGVGANGREVVVDAYDGRILWLGKKGEKLQAVDDSYAIVRPEDGKSVVSYAYGASRPRWTKPVHDSKAQTAITPYAVVTVQEDPHRITAWAPSSGKELVTIKSEAKVWAVGPAGMIIGEGRHIGYVPFAGVTSTPNGTRAPNGTGAEGCDGPKEPQCRAEK
ncbi:PQQ-binding-like beta-propeller repeat protein [Phytohabitans aurantiacus]|uniref:Pyrroloquinoline-quinone binding quinoprotein n=1 Tax=Phytohabitans aurantiacus TaxID=3016789 RepID=A0ABQ5R5M7_9ACTN|nr:hypothetical protein [Phytohabitans aurantiacus]GLI02087.1 hypothetical protein Pa4123_73650 [Phytohabitans aurantiacus]